MTGNRWSDLGRPPLNEDALRRALVHDGSLWREVTVVEAAGSTNSDLAARARAGDAAEGSVLIAEEQTAGRGRLERTWTAPARSGLFLSVLLTPAEVPEHRWGWIPLLAGLGVATALPYAAGVDTALKWPNDVLVTIDEEERKIGGILAERTPAGGDAEAAGVVLGIGLNVSLTEDELPVPGAASLALANARTTDRDPLLRAVLRSLEKWYVTWRAAAGDPVLAGVMEAYAAGCSTLGRTVRAELPGGESLTGEAVAIDGDGRLVLATDAGMQRPVSAADVVHLRKA